MLLQFRQGIAAAQTPTFINVTYPAVDLVVTDTNTIITFAAGTKNYLYTEQQSVQRAWGPLTSGKDQWLYWDINSRTGHRTFGITLHEPIVAAVAPAAPVNDQHWFDTSTNTMNVWIGKVWTKQIRAFAVKLANGKIPVGMGPSGAIIGTQVGNNTTAYAGNVLFDSVGSAIRDNNGQFVTTEDSVSTKAMSLSSVKLASLMVTAEAQQNMSSHTIVVFSEFGKIVHASQFVAEQPLQFGIIEQNVVVGQTVNVVTSGMISSDAFNFSAQGVNALLYCDAAGQLVTAPVIPNQRPVAIVVDRKTIQLGVALASSTDTIPVINLATDTVYGISRLSVPAEDAEDPIVVGDNDPRFDSFVRKPGDTMTGQLNQMVDGIVNNITYGQGPGGTGNHSNTVFGWSAMLNNTTGDRNTVFGSSAMAMNTTGFGNVAVGADAGTNTTSGANNVMIGYNAGNDAVASISSQSNYVVIGNNSTTNANIKVSWTVTSDARDKTDIQPIGVGLEFVNQLKPKQFKLMDRETQQATTGVRYGFLAQDVLESEGATTIIVDVTDADNLKMHESMVVPALVKAVQDLSAKLDAALSKIAALEAK